MYLSKCHKRFITSTLAIILFTYLIWLIELKIIDNAQTDAISKRNENTMYRQQFYDININNDAKIQNRHDRVLLLAQTIMNDNKYDDVVLNGEFENLMKFMDKINAFLIDIKLLRKIKDLESNGNNKIFHYIHKSLSDYTKFDEKTFLSFGIYAGNFFQIKDFKLQNTCEVVYANGTNDQGILVTNVYFLCSTVNIQMTLFYNRGEFIWTGKDNFESNHLRWFGDVPRAFHAFELAKINGSLSYSFNIPINLQKLLFDYDHSKFLECNRTLADYNLRILGSGYKQNTMKNDMILPVIKHIASTLEGFEKHYWLAGGTLLGWYRDCGIIPHTQDVDFAVWAHEYDSKIKKAFLGDKIVRLWGTLGLVNDSYEFRMFNDLFTFDMFLLYKTNETHQWCGYQVNRSKFKRWLPNFNELCSAELLGNKFLIPCDPIKYLNTEYGNEARWITPNPTNYTWSNVVYSSSWTDAEWPNVVKYYDKDGNLLTKKILKYLNQHSKMQITEVHDTES